MSALSSAQEQRQGSPRKNPAKGKDPRVLHIVRHGGGPGAILHRDVSPARTARDSPSLGAGTPSKPALAEGARELIELLERIGVDFISRNARALGRYSFARLSQYPRLWLSDEEMLEKGPRRGLGSNRLKQKGRRRLLPAFLFCHPL